MEFLIILLVLLTIITLIGHGIWVAIRAFIRLLVRDDEKTDDGVTRIFEPPIASGPLNDLAATERQLVRFYRDGKINDETYELLLARIRAERDTLLGRQTTAPNEIKVCRTEELSADSCRLWQFAVCLPGMSLAVCVRACHLQS